MRTTIDISDDLMQELRFKSVQEKKTLKELINSLLSEALKKTSSRKNRKRWKCISYELGPTSYRYERAWEMIDHLEEEAVSEKLDLQK